MSHGKLQINNIIMRHRDKTNFSLFAIHQRKKYMYAKLINKIDLGLLL